MAVTPRQSAEHFQRRAELTERKILEATERARIDARRIAVHLREHYRVRKVFLFGSISRGGVHECSDLDLAVEGLDSQSYFKALAECMALSEVPLDLVRLEDAPPEFRSRIQREGTELT